MNGKSWEQIFLNKDERRLRAGWRLVCQLLLFAGFAIGASVLIFPLFTDGPISLIGEELIRMLAMMIPVFLARRFLDRRSFASLGMVIDRRAARDFLVGFGISGITISLMFGAFWALGWLRVEGFAWQSQSTSILAGSVLITLFVLIISGWSEELMARGYWLQNIEEGLNVVWAVTISSALFSLNHIINPGYSWMAFLGLFLGGFDLAYGYIRTRMLWLPIGLHVGWNFFEGTVYGFQLSGLGDVSYLIAQTLQGPVIWTGGEFGPEAGLVMVPAVLLNVLLISIYSNR